jgi:hypothetical protein
LFPLIDRLKPLIIILKFILNFLKKEGKKAVAKAPMASVADVGYSINTPFADQGVSVSDQKPMKEGGGESYNNVTGEKGTGGSEIAWLKGYAEDVRDAKLDRGDGTVVKRSSRRKSAGRMESIAAASRGEVPELEEKEEKEAKGNEKVEKTNSFNLIAVILLVGFLMFFLRISRYSQWTSPQSI